MFGFDSIFESIFQEWDDENKVSSIKSRKRDRVKVIEPDVSATTDGKVLINLGSGLPSIRLTPENAQVLVSKLTQATEMAKFAASKDKK